MIDLLRGPFYFLRHGEVDTNRLGLIAGMQDIPLNETGRRQARTAAGQLRDRGIGAIYSSPLARARATADCVAAVLGLPVIGVAELAERAWGELEGKPRALRRLDMTPAGGEGLEAFTRRTLAGLTKVARHDLPLVVAHSGTYRVLCRELGIEIREPVPVPNCEPLRFVQEGDRWRIETLCACA